MNSLNRTPILPQQTTQGSQAPQQTSVIINDSNLWANIPEELKERAQWAVSGASKAPLYVVDGYPVPAKSNDPATWMNFNDACTFAWNNRGRVTSHTDKHGIEVKQQGYCIGYMLSADDPFTCIDLDVKDASNCTDASQWTTPDQYELYQRIILNFASFTEYSRSGKGFHIWVKGNIGKGRRREGVEVYSQERFIVCTGNIYKNHSINERSEFLNNMVTQLSPLKLTSDIEPIDDQPQVESDESIIEKASKAENKHKFQALWNAELDTDLHTIGLDHSQADASLVQILAFYTPNNEQLIRLWHQSNLGKRKKAKREDYINLTVNKARLHTMSDLIKEQKYFEHGKQMAESLMTTYNNKKFNKSQLPFFMTDEDLEKLPPPSWLVDDLIPETGIGVIYGESGSYKSFLTIDLLAHIGNGKAWFGKDTKQKPVIYIALEGKGGIPKRIKSWKIHNHSSSNIKVIHNPIDFRDNSNIEYLIEKIKDAELDGGVICVDTLAQAGGDMDENSSKDMGKMIKTFQYIQQELGGVVLIVHHSGKDKGRGMRGHSSLYASLDFALECNALDKNKRKASFKIAKSKDGDSSLNYNFTLNIINTGYENNGKPITSLAVSPVVDMTTIQKSELEKQKLAELDKSDDIFIWNWISKECAQGNTPSKNSLKGQLNEMKMEYDIIQNRIFSAVDRLLASGKVIRVKQSGNPYLRAISN